MSLRLPRSSWRYISKAVAFSSAIVISGTALSVDTANGQKPPQDQWSELRRGTIVDFEVVNPEMKCEGAVAARQVDTIIVTRSYGCWVGDFERTRVRSFRMQFYEGARSNHAGTGLLVGLVTGAILGRLAGPKCFYEGPCKSEVATPGLAAGAFVGAIIGTVIGLGRDAGGQWRAMPIPATIRLSDTPPN